MKKIIYILPNLHISSGVSSVVMNYYKKINKENIHIDFLLINSNEESYEKDVLKEGGKIFYLKNKPSILNLKKVNKELFSFFKNNKYDIVELHAPTFSFIFLKIAKKCNIPVRIVHSHSTIHSTNKIKNALSIILNINLKKYANIFFACSEKSGKYWYGKKICNSNEYKVITNAININDYKYDEKARETLRDNYNLKDNIVVGFVGRLSKDKNLLFLVKVMKEVIKKNNQYKLLIIGDGPELKKIKIKCKNIKSNVIFLGRRNDVNKQLNCMDLFVLPSKREGLPMSVVEAQLSEITCLLSNTITKEVDIGRVKFLKLNKKQWVNEILNFEKQEKIINKEKFNIDLAAKELEDIYCDIYKIGE